MLCSDLDREIVWQQFAAAVELQSKFLKFTALRIDIEPTLN
jgi:hypothetical protein